MEEKTLYITFEVTISNGDYWNTDRESAELKVVIPESIIGDMNSGNMFDLVLKAAMKKFNDKMNEKAVEQE